MYVVHQKFNCDYCNSKFNDKLVLEQHKVIHNRPKRKNHDKEFLSRLRSELTIDEEMMIPLKTEHLFLARRMKKQLTMTKMRKF